MLEMLLYIYLTGLFFSLFVVSYFYELIFWPVLATKYLALGLFKILFTNWKI